jgi:hypothetical protein
LGGRAGGWRIGQDKRAFFATTDQGGQGEQKGQGDAHDGWLTVTVK